MTEAEVNKRLNVEYPKLLHAVRFCSASKSDRMGLSVILRAVIVVLLEKIVSKPSKLTNNGLFSIIILEPVTLDILDNGVKSLISEPLITKVVSIDSQVGKFTAKASISA